jgi:hypothetical protein
LFNGSSISVEVLDDDEISVGLYFDYNFCCLNFNGDEDRDEEEEDELLKPINASIGS